MSISKQLRSELTLLSIKLSILDAHVHHSASALGVQLPIDKEKQPVKTKQ